MRELFSVHRRLIGLGLMGVLVLALAALGSLWALTQTTSAVNGDSVVLVHVNPDGTDYAGNDYCPDGGLPVDDDGDTEPDRWIDDCNNITSQRHVIRTDGLAALEDAVGIGFTLGEDGVGEIVGISAPCGTLPEVTDRPAWGDDDGDGLKDEDGDDCANALDDDLDGEVNDGCPVAGVNGETAIAGACNTGDANDDDGDTVVNDGCPVVGIAEAGLDNDGDTVADEDPPGDPRDDEWCVVIHSSWPGETVVRFTFGTITDGEESGAECANNVDDDGDGAVNDGCPTGVPEAACADAETVCGADTADDDGDTLVNDGCPANGLSEDAATQCGNNTDDDGDTEVNDGCPVVGGAAADEDGDGLMNDGCPAVGDPEEGADCADTADNDDDGLINDGCPAAVAEVICGADANDDLEDPTPDGLVNDGCPIVDPILTEYTTLDVVKEWDSLVDSVILLDEPADVDGDTDIDAVDHHLADVEGSWQSYPVVWDEGVKRVRSYPPVQIIEIVHGEHDVLINSETITLHHPTEGAIFYAEIDSDNGCTYFTNPRLEVSSGATTVVYPAGAFDFGDAMNGVSDTGGRFLGPHVAPAQTQGVTSLAPDAHNGPSPNVNPVTGLDWDIQDLWIDTICEEQATITITAGYPGTPGSLRVPAIEVIHINWETVEEAKQPQIRWAGEQIVLEKRWALPDTYFPNFDVDGTLLPVCPHAGKVVQYNREDPSPGGLEEGIPNLTAANAPDSVSTIVDASCISRAMYESEEPGQVDVKTVLWEYDDFWGGQRVAVAAALDVCIADFNLELLEDLNGDTVVDVDDVHECHAAVLDGWHGTLEELLEPGDLVEVSNKHAFLVWYIKIYQVSLTNTTARYDDHNAGDVDVEPIVATEDDGYVAPDTDSTLDELNVSESTVLRVLVKGWFFGGNNSSRGAVCIDKDGDGDEAGSTPGEPYPLGQYEEGCADSDDEILDHGHWVLPDDIEDLAGASAEFTRRSWDVMSDVGDTPADLEGVEGGFIGPKSTLDSHDNVVRPWLGRKTVDPDGEITVADAIMPPLKIRAIIEDPYDAGFFHHNVSGMYPEVDKDAESNLYDAILIPASPEIPWQVNNGGYDWDSTLLGPYEFWHIFNKPVSVLDGCDDGPGALCNATLGNQNDHRSDDPDHPRIVELYTDNRGEAQIGLNGDYNLDFGLGLADGCTLQELWGAPDCEEGDVVGWTTVQVIGDYPYFRKHASVLSNPVDKIWIWGGYKEVTAERIDATHTAIIAHLKDRDGYCKYDVDVDEDDEIIDVIFSPSANPVQHEEITFILNTEVGSVVSISNYAGFSAPHTPLGEAIVTSAEDGVLIDRSEAVALAEDARVLEGMELFGMVPVGARDPIEEDECQAWIVIEHPTDQDPDVSVYFDDPEGTVARHWPPDVLLVPLVMGWNDACYIGPSASVEVAAEDLLDDENENELTDLLAIYRFNNEDQTFDRWFPEAEEGVNTIDTLEPYDQLFVLMEVSIDWLQPITPAPDSADLVEGWNSVCYAGSDKAVELATSNVIGDFEILYTLALDQMWRRFVPGEAWLTNIITLNKYTSVFLLVTTEGGATWVFDP